MNYYESNSRTSRIGGVIATLVYLVLLLLLLIFVRFSHEVELIEQGIMVDFGDSQTGSGVEDMDATDTPVQPSQSSEQPAPTEYLTDDNSPAEIESADIESSSQVDSSPQDVTQTQAQTEVAREVNQRALFPGRTLSSGSSSQGSDEQAEGNQGEQSGEQDGSPSDTGAGVEGVSWNLSGRSVVGRLPIPTYSDNATGRVVMEIIVDDSGRVTRATYRAEGSTTNSSQLVSAAQKAALAAKFTPSGEFAQVGTITYTFRLN